MRPGVAREQETAGEQQCEDRVPALLGELRHRRDVLKARVRNHAVQPSETLDRRLDLASEADRVTIALPRTPHSRRMA